MLSNKIFSPDLDKATIKPSCYEISYQKLIFPRRYGGLNQTDQCAQKVGFPRSGHIYLLFINYFTKLTQSTMK